jgi:transcriptional regulator with XRE-family HTH domain
MNSYVFDIGSKARKASRFIGRVRSELQRALVAEKAAQKITQQQIATKLGVNRSVINRQLLGKENMTLRSVAELAWALGWEIRFELRKPVSLEARFGIPQTTTTAPPPKAIPTNQQTVVVTRTDKDLEVAA